jgi:nucleotide-binding universal stress UspA family protein
VAALRYVAELATTAGVVLRRCQRTGEVADQVLREATRQGADLVVIARPNGHRVGSSALGGQAAQVLEFAEVPVLLVPPSGAVDC